MLIIAKADNYLQITQTILLISNKTTLSSQQLVEFNLNHYTIMILQFFICYYTEFIQHVNI